MIAQTILRRAAIFQVCKTLSAHQQFNKDVSRNSYKHTNGYTHTHTQNYSSFEWQYVKGELFEEPDRLHLVPHEASVAQLVVNSFTTFYSVQVFVLYMYNRNLCWLSWLKYAKKGNWRTNFQRGLETLLKLVINLQVRRAWWKIAKFRRNILTSRSCGPRHPPCCMELTVQWTFNSEGKS